MRVAPEIVLTSDERAELTRLVRSRLTSVRLAQRARIVRRAAQGLQNQEIAAWEWTTHPVGSLSIQVLTPTQCVMDRLAAFYHWRDRQALEQAVAVARAQTVDLDEIRRWSAEEGQESAHLAFVRALPGPETGRPSDF